MLRGIYTAATNMVTQRKKIDVIANNVANAETAGFKADTLISRSFRDLLLSKVKDPAVLYTHPEVGPLNTGVRVDEVVTSFDQGDAVETSKPTDLLLLGSGYFVLSTPQGECYTRDGSLQVTADGYLVNQDGHYVQGDAGNLYVGDARFTVGGDGSILRSDGTSAGRLRLAAFEDEGGLRKIGNNLYVNYTNQQLTAAECEVKQGYLEASNVNMANEILNMMNVYRTYETSQRVVRMMDESLGKAVNEVGKV
ncbi:MAG: flagellar hook-basal body protein [Christensenellales bacterium]|jgi:flagellar basal-body rod protein FlgF